MRKVYWKFEKNLFEKFHGVIPTAYALLPDTENNRNKKEYLVRNHAIVTIFYDPDIPEKSSHLQVDAFLEQFYVHTCRALNE